MQTKTHKGKLEFDLKDVPVESFYVVCVDGSSSISGWTKHLKLI